MEKETRIVAEAAGNLRKELSEIQKLVCRENAMDGSVTSTRKCGTFLTIYCC